MKSTIRLKTVTRSLLVTLALVCFGLLPTAKALLPPPAPDGGYPGGNTAEGNNALHDVNTAVGINNTAVGANALTHDTTGNYNVAVGSGALASNTTGDFNMAIGADALRDNNASFNLAIGFRVGFMNTTGNHLTGTGAAALRNNTTASFNTAIGADALRENTTGENNTAIGSGALTNLNGGDRNTAIGRGAGATYTGAESNNICIGDQTGGETGESNTIRIGSNMPSGGLIVGGVDPFSSDFFRIGSNMPSGGMIVGSVGALKSITIGAGFTGGGIQYQELIGQTVSIGPNFVTFNGSSHCFIGGIFNQTPTAGSHSVVIGSDNRLADASLSSRRFKKDIAPIDKISEGILALKPVTFHLKNDDTNYPQFGLIAEEVAEVNPDWITRDPQGEIYGVRYDTIPILLLNEFLKEHHQVQEQNSKIQQQEATIAELKSTVAQQQQGLETVTARLDEQAAQIQKVSAQLTAASPSLGGLEASKPAPQVVKNAD
jgi:trimeric autotransporter adhesin